MIKAYLLSIFVWMALIVFTTIFSKSKIIQNGQLDGAAPSTFSQGMVTLILVAATPVVRFLICATMLYMTTTTKEQFEEKYKDEDDE